VEHITVAVPIARVFVGLGCTVAGTITIITYRFQELCCAVADFAFELRHIPPLLRRTASGTGLGVDSPHELLCGVTRRYLRDMLRRRQASFCGSGLSDRGFTLRLTEPLFGDDTASVSAGWSCILYSCHTFRYTCPNVSEPWRPDNRQAIQSGASKA
jgi:hypothetical protein